MRIDVDGVHVTLAGTDVLQTVDASVDEGRLVGLVGPNGAGKTTLLRTITAALDPDDGAVFVGDEDIHDLASRAASRRLASVPQKTNLDFEFTVREVVEMGRHPHRNRFGGGDDDTQVVDTALERAEVASLADRTVITLSGGERQRVLLARALAQDAPVLVLDEPTASLDVHHQIRTLGLVRNLVDDGRTGIAAIHDLDLAARFCDSLLLVSDGGVLAAGPPKEVLTADRLRDAFGADAVVTQDPITQTPRVTVRDTVDATGDSGSTVIGAHVHVVGGTNQVADALPQLADAVADLTVGPVLAGSSDEQVATSLGLDPVTVEPYSSGQGSGTDEASALWDSADVVVVPSSLPSGRFPERIRAGPHRLVEPGTETSPAKLLAAIADVLNRPVPAEELTAD